jgi:PAS domain S-box-containing protein
MESEELLESILRGAAKILGCGSANLIVFNTETGEVRIQVGVINERYPKLKEIESVAGDAFQSMVFRLEDTVDSMVYASWRDRAVYETASLAELSGSVFPVSLVEQGPALIGDHRFICVPVLSGERVFGVIIFTKEDIAPFGVQQREILIRYAQRIGEIIECDLSHRSVGPRSSQLFHAQLLYFALGETAPAIMVAPDFTITSSNEATEQLLGWQAAELLSKPVGILFRDPDEIDNLLNHQFLFMTDGYHEDKAEVRHKSGRVFLGRVEALLLADESNQFMGYMILIRDAKAPRDGYDSANVAQLMRRERLATMGEMAGQLAHEMRNPLVSIGATLEMLGRDETICADNREILSGLVGEVNRLDMLLRDYLSLSSRRNAPITKVDLWQVIEDVRRLMRGAREGEGKETINSVGRGVEVLADYEGMRHVVLNLIRNALEASPPGGRVNCHALSGERDVRLIVEDEGPGLAAPAVECVQSFFTTKKNGTGLGLTVCQKIVQAYFGTLTLENIEGGGCRATVVLPRKVCG